MKQQIALLFMVLCSNVYADVMVFNQSQNNIEVTYRFCYMYYNAEGPFDCEKDYSKITIQGRRYPSNTSYVLLNKQPSKEGSFSRRFMIASAVEKDENGVVVAQSNYLPTPPINPNYDTSDCLAEDYYQYSDNGVIDKNTLSTAIILDDMNRSPVITCQAGHGISYGGTKIE